MRKLKRDPRRDPGERDEVGELLAVRVVLGTVDEDSAIPGHRNRYVRWRWSHKQTHNRCKLSTWQYWCRGKPVVKVGGVPVSDPSVYEEQE